ncbi:GntR family transcriptional regulator [Gellertiella hungarica]|uniref:DNA-binding GntR family transcriptional regulator n=1 Tax=Gellertiella hungarica TaxID=1572859 RepID=A0A7W6J6E5_9HYPH|nr:GntR family transcriptional regulator [Gellertiella hungarica]MBB4065641.1 DNA-binding GntR family transcriptional regulator [Gellertiella hungarica]
MDTTTGFDAAPLTRIETTGPLSQRVYLALRDAILSLAYAPGAMLRKAAICEALGVSRSPVSEAIARLAAEGLVDVVPQSGTRVSRFSLEEIREASFMREALEAAAVAKVAVDHTPEQLAQLTRSLRLQQLLLDDGDNAGFYEADEAFHAMLMEATGYPNLVGTVSTISLKLKRPRILLLPEEGRPAAVVAEHAAIVDAIRNRDPAGADRAMRFHLGQLINRFASLGESHPDYFRPRPAGPAGKAP